VLLHGFPYDAHGCVEAATLLAAGGARAIVPWLRGFGPTRFRAADTPRSGEQAALGADLLALLDALDLQRAVLAGFDWGGRAACVVSALWPERVVALVTANGYNIHDIARSVEPRPAAEEAAFWYQWYFHGERGRRGLERDRRGIARLLWRQWSPDWRFDDATFERSAAAFDNADFVEVTLHSYRHRHGLAPGDCGGGRDRGAARRAAVDHGADDASGRQRRRRDPEHGAPCAELRRALPVPRARGGRARLAAGAARAWADAVREARAMATGRA
jgi:pimeloyl-ACP methyl ester carboxylesterase